MTRTLAEWESDLLGWRAAERERANSRRMKGALTDIAKRGLIAFAKFELRRPPAGYPKDVIARLERLDR